MANYLTKKVPKEGEKTLSRRVYSILRENIIDGLLKPGERLVRKEIATRLGVSTLPVIEALYMLEIDGYVENRPLAGCRVRSLTIEDINDDLMLREALECQVARLCALNLKPRDGDKLMKLAQQVDRFTRADTTDPTLGNQMHLEFHLELGRLSGCGIFVKMLKKVWFQQYMKFNSLKSIKILDIPKEWHQLLVRQLLTGDPDTAEQAMRKHVQFGSQFDHNALEAYLSEESAPQTKN
ncbi:MAG: GntR family transcriptional regulator [Kiritimatiellae bacterium]|jgi:DNA-binding GntR family transcriptional regulator|nr:GntR family transcriptional regulator [Kiritimatiellia bacterium]